MRGGSTAHRLLRAGASSALAVAILLLACSQAAFAASPTLSVTITTDKPSWNLGTNVGHYSIVVSNVGTAQTSGAITVTMTLPSGLTVSGNPGGGGFNCTVTGGNQLSCTWPNSNLNPNQADGALNVNVDVASGTASSVSETVYAYGGNDPVHDSQANAVSASVTQTINLPSLSVTKTDKNAPWTVGQGNAQYIITLTNTGSGPTAGTMTITDSLPDFLTVNGNPAANGGFTCTVTNSTDLSCTSTTPLNVNKTAQITINVVVGNGTPSSVTNTASAYGGGDPVHVDAGSAATGSVTTSVSSLSDAALAIGPSANPSASGSYDGVAASNDADDFTAVAIQRGGTEAVTNPDGSGKPMSVTLSASNAPCIAHTAEIVSGGGHQLSVDATAPTGWQVGLYSDAACSVPLTGMTVGETTTGALGNINPNVPVQVYSQYTTSSAVTITPFARYDGVLYLYQSGHLNNGTNTTHDELFYGYVSMVKAETIQSSTCPGGSGACSGSIIKYTVTYTNTMPSGYAAGAEASLAPRPFPYALSLSVVEDGIAQGWGTTGSMSAAPTDTTAGTTFSYTKNGVPTGSPVGATAFTATIGGSGYGGLTPGSTGTVTFTVTVN